MTELQRLYSPPEIGAPGKRSGRLWRRDLRLAGIFVLSMLTLASVGLIVLGRSGLIGSYQLTSYFRSASGLTPGISVLQEGYQIGVVTAVEPVFPRLDQDAARCLDSIEESKPAGTREPEPQQAATGVSAKRSPPVQPCFRASLRIRKDWPIPMDSRARLGSAGLLQGEAILIQPGSAARPLAPGSILPNAGKTPDLMAQLDQLTGTLQALIDQTIAPALASIQAQVQMIGRLMGTEPGIAAGTEAELDTVAAEDAGLAGEEQRHIAGVLENLQTLSQEMVSSVDPEQIRAILDSVQQLSANLEKVSATLTARSDQIQTTVQDYGALAGDIRGLIRQTEPSIERGLDDTAFLLQELATALGPILANIEDASRNLSAITRDLRHNPSVILRGRKEPDQAPWFAE